MAEKLGVGSTDLDSAKIRMLNEPEAGMGDFPKTSRIQELASHVTEKEACSACYGSLIHALGRLQEEGLLSDSLPEIAIGQGFRNADGSKASDAGSSDLAGIGNCTKGLARFCPGCPPKASGILAFLKTLC